MIINFETEDCIECDIRIRVINALYAIAKNELDHNGTTGFLLTIAQAIEQEARTMIDLLSNQTKDLSEQPNTTSISRI